jgi:arylsulfatase A-like enzyme
MNRPPTWLAAALTSLTILGCSDSGSAPEGPDKEAGSLAPTSNTVLLAGAPEDFAEFLNWAENKLRVVPAPQPLPTQAKLSSAQWPIIRLADHVFDDAVKRSTWAPRDHRPRPLAEIGPFRADDAASRFFAVRDAPAATPDGKASIKLIMGGFNVQCEELGRIDLEVTAPFGKHVTLKWAKAGEIPLPINSNSKKVLIPLLTDGLSEWGGKLSTIELISDGKGDGVVEVHKLRFMSKTDSYPAAIAQQRVRVHSEIQSAIYAHSPAEIRYGNVSLPEGAKLSVSIAAESAKPDPVTFEVLVEFDGASESVLRETIEPGQSWKPVAASLEKWAGKTVAVILKSDCPIPETAALWGNPEIYQPVQDPPFVVVYLIDTLAAGHINLYGHGRPTMPVLSALGNQGAWFPQMVSNSPRTVESVADLMLSMTTERHGVHHNLNPAPVELVSLADAMRAAGFATASFVTNVYAGPRQNMDQGFDTFVDKIGFWWSDDAELADRTVPLDDTMKWIDAHADRPRFMYVHTAEPHAPYTPPEGNRGKFDPDYTGPFAGNYRDPKQPNKPSFQQARNPRDIQHIAALYDEEINYADARLGQFLVGLRERGLLDKVSIFITADHGEEFLQHGAWEHGLNLHNEQTRVPLVASGPLVGNAGRVDAPAATVDIMPTILDLCGLPVPYELEGRSLAPRLRGQGGGEGDKRTIYGSNYNYYGATGNIEFYALEGGRWKLMFGARPRPMSGGGPTSHFALFDVQNDPTERHNAVSEQQEVSRRMIGELIAWRARQHPYVTSGVSTGAVTDPKQIEQLSGLGYIGGSDEVAEPVDGVELLPTSQPVSSGDEASQP